MLIIRNSGSTKTKSFFNLIGHQPDIDKIYLYSKDLYEPKHQILLNQYKDSGLKHFNDSKAFIEFLNDMSDIHKNIEEYNANKQHNILIVFNDIISVMLCN